MKITTNYSTDYSNHHCVGVDVAGDCAAHPPGVHAAPDNGHGESQPITELHLHFN